MGCPLDGCVVGEEYEIQTQNLCEECGYVASRHAVAIYLGLGYRGEVPTHMFLQHGYYCPECGKGIEQINAPCGGISHEAFVQERLDDCIGIPISEEEYDTEIRILQGL